VFSFVSQTGKGFSATNNGVFLKIIKFTGKQIAINPFVNCLFQTTTMWEDEALQTNFGDDSRTRGFISYIHSPINTLRTVRDWFLNEVENNKTKNNFT
jgi:hypothetical protein